MDSKHTLITDKSQFKKQDKDLLWWIAKTYQSIRNSLEDNWSTGILSEVT